jgi:hypothetical protein
MTTHSLAEVTRHPLYSGSKAQPLFVNRSLFLPVFAVTDRIIVIHRGRKVAEQTTPH